MNKFLLAACAALSLAGVSTTAAEAQEAPMPTVWMWTDTDEVIPPNTPVANCYDDWATMAGVHVIRCSPPVQVVYAGPTYYAGPQVVVRIGGGQHIERSRGRGR